AVRLRTRAFDRHARSVSRDEGRARLDQRQAVQPVRPLTKTHPRIRGGIGARYASLGFGLFLFALAVVLILESKLGLSPWDLLNQGIAKHTPLSFGTANIAVGLVVLGIGWSLGGKPGVGTVANAVLVGTFIQLLTSVHGM